MEKGHIVDKRSQDFALWLIMLYYYLLANLLQYLKLSAHAASDLLRMELFLTPIIPQNLSKR